MKKNKNLTFTHTPNLPLTHLELLKKYYSEVFNVEMINTFIKETKKTKKNRAILSIQNDDSLEGIFGELQDYQMIIWIKDKNKIIFKNRILKFDFRSNKTKEWIKYHVDNNDFVDLIDFQVSQYCQKYMKKDKDFNKIKIKNNDFQNKYRYENNKMDL